MLEVDSPTRERTRRAILQAGIGTLIEHPSASIADVAQRAGVARSTLHRYYAGRKELVDGINAFVEHEYESALEKAKLDEGTGLEAYTRLCLELLESFDVFAWWFQETPEAGWEDEPDELRIAAAVARGQADGSIDPSLPAGWLSMTLWSNLYTARFYTQSGAATPRQAREYCLRTLLKCAAP
ncbi:TetR/AcrR family transcriptional regulator [Kribbella solani]|uniref:AcrR family transcriptional regulator n=1 Tax=Kribbella solani TaxID=236067 RepID=A0A841DR08_9ACTN|nr:TetR/AcrR family transcriptional regulator [Kribbella solani]MBB5979355.1 AcrR family transcriptional regulator [Kribbella solani]